MADFLTAFAACARVQVDAPGAVATPLEPLQAVSLTAWPGRVEALTAALQGRFGLSLPVAGHWAQANDLVAVWAGPGHWRLHREGAVPLFAEVLPVAGTDAAVIDVSHATATLRLSGPDVREMLARLLPIDLHPRAFAPGHAAATVAAHLPVQVRNLDGAKYELSCPRSGAASLWRALDVAGNGRLQLR